MLSRIHLCYLGFACIGAQAIESLQTAQLRRGDSAVAQNEGDCNFIGISLRSSRRAEEVANIVQTFACTAKSAMVARIGTLGPWREEVLISEPCMRTGLILTPHSSCSSLRFSACAREQEDVLLRRLIKEHGVKKWSSVAEGVPGRSGKSCRLRYLAGRRHWTTFYSSVYHIYSFCRWYNQLCPHLKKESFDEDEDCVIIKVL